MRISKTQQRIDWIKEHMEGLEAARSDMPVHDGSNGRTNANQSGPGWGWWANALTAAGCNPERKKYWSGSPPTPSTSINYGLGRYIYQNAPKNLL